MLYFSEFSAIISTRFAEGFQSGQMEQTVNLSPSASMVRIHPPPPDSLSCPFPVFLNSPSCVPCFLQPAFMVKFCLFAFVSPVFAGTFPGAPDYLTKAIKLKRDYCHPGGIPAQYGSIPALVAQSRPRSRSALQTHI